MILILSEDRDGSAKKVVSWLKKMKVEYLHLNETQSKDSISSIMISNNCLKIYFVTKNESYDISKFKAVWFRRGNFKFGIPDLILKDNRNSDIKTKIYEHLNQEISTISDFIYDYLQDSLTIINDPRFYNFNKLNGLKNARKCGLKIPESILTDRKEIVDAFQKRNNKQIVTKNIQDLFSYRDDLNEKIWYQQTFLINEVV